MKIMTEIINDLLKEQAEREKALAEYYSAHPECLRCSVSEGVGCCKCAR